MTFLESKLKLLLGLVVAIVCLHVDSVNAAISCTSTFQCELFLRRGSICNEQGFCSNPFVQGCLKTHNGLFFPKRICNSDDEVGSKDCESVRRNKIGGVSDNSYDYTDDHQNIYPEIRIAPGDWESAIFYSWVMQILLMEVLHVPVTVGLTTSTTSMESFYSPVNTLVYTETTYPFDALIDAVDCHTTEAECAQVLPEVWETARAEYTEFARLGLIEPVEGNGEIGKVDWFIPKFTAERDPSLVSYIGLQGEENRQKLAETFLKPIMWREYCETISYTNCSVPDNVARNYPRTAEQEVMYFYPDSFDGGYTGYFHDDNNCAIYPDTCTGHIVGPACDWGTYIDVQLHQSDIHLRQDGPIYPNGGYDSSSMIQIWRAANATKSNVIFWWWRPDALPENFHGTDAEFKSVSLPFTTNACVENRLDSDGRCSEDINVRRGGDNPLGGCDQGAHTLNKIVASSLQTQTDEQPIGSRSPGLAAIKNIKISDTEMNYMLQQWVSTSVDRYGNDAREAVCDWVIDNYDDLLAFLPPEPTREYNVLPVGIVAFGCTVTVISWILNLYFLSYLYKHRWDRVVVVSQIEFLVLLCVGAMISSSTMVALSFQADGQDTHAASVGCTVAPFLYSIGWILQYSSLSAKTLRLYKIVKNTEKEGQQVNIISAFSVVYVVVVALLIDLAFVIALTVVNPLVYKLVETGSRVENGQLTIEYDGRCDVTDPDGIPLWAFMAPVFVFHMVLLLVTNILLVNVRKMKDRYQEAKYIVMASLIMLEMIVVGIPILAAVGENYAAIFIVFLGITSVHDICILCVMFIPKIRLRRKGTKGAERKLDNVIMSSLASVPKSKFGRAMKTIDDILDDEGGVLDLLTPVQISELETIQTLLLHNQTKRQSNLMHIPAELAKQTGARDLTQTNRFIMNEFGGVRLDASSIFSLEESSRGFDTDSSSMSVSTKQEFIYVPPEFVALKRESRIKAFELLSWSSLRRWDFNIFDLLEATEGNPLLFVGWAVLGSPHSQNAMAHCCGVAEITSDERRGYGFADSAALQIPMKKLCDYLRAIEKDYFHENPYHNEIHAADVVQTLHSLIQMMGDFFKATDEELFSILLAAVVHDVSHPGKNNSFQANARSDLALLYNDESVLENWHASHAFMKMLGDKQSSSSTAPGPLPQRRPSFINYGHETDLNILCNVSEKDLKSIRSKVVGAVLHTDMSKHFASVNSLDGIVKHKGVDNLDDSNTRWQIMQYMMHLADISNPAKPDPMFKIWTERCLEEFFSQGDKESELGLPISPNCDRKTVKKANSQIGFIQFVIKPAYVLLGEILPEVAREVLPVIDNNMNYWKGQKEKES